MPVDKEWNDRINRWMKELTRHFYQPLADVELEGFVTTEQLTAEQAMGGEFSPMPVGTPWGGKWEYGWFRGEISVPAEARGRRVHFMLDVGGQGTLLFVDGKVVGGRDVRQDGWCVTREATGEEKLTILAEVYAGHGARNTHAGPTPPGRLTVPEPPATQQTVGRSTVGVWQEEIYQLWVDAETLRQIADAHHPDDLRTAQIERALKDMTLIVDFELPREQMLRTVVEARSRLADLLAATNGTTAPRLYGFGHGHLDIAWLWPLEESERKIARTLINQLNLIDEYPGHVFLQPQPHLFMMLRDRYPELYERVKAAAGEGGIIADGASWVEMDTNISGGEALIRQFIHGRRFFREEFDVDSELLWLPDVFGYSGGLPQILRGCGVKFFSTQKIFWTYHGGEVFPHNAFTWEGVDGSEVFVHLHNSYGSKTWPSATIQRWRQRVQKEGFTSRPFPFGESDGGGGPDRNDLEFIRRQEDLEGCPRVRLAGPMEYFRDQVEEGWPDVRYVGELYYQEHRGVYTSQARTKKGNRKSEIALREAEMWATAARALGDFEFSPRDLDDAWREVMLNQFHDILPGSSIARVYEQAEAGYERAIASAGRTALAAARSFAADAEGVVVLNSLSWSRSALVELPEGINALQTSEGKPLPAQQLEGKTYAQADVPSCGWTTLTPADAPADAVGGVRATDRSLENEHLRVELDDLGQVVALVDKASGFDFAAGPGNVMRMFKDVPTKYDAWDIDSMYADQPVTLDAPASLELVAQGPLMGVIRVRRTLHESDMVQEICLVRGGRRVEFKTTIEWRESHKLLKVAFPLAVHTDEVVSEVQFGAIRRPNHKSRPFDAERFEVCNQKWSALLEEGRGAAILNDCKYGLNAVGNTLQLTLLKSPMAPAMDADKGTQEFTYAVTVWDGPLMASPVVREAYEVNVPPTMCRGQAGERSLFAVDADNVLVETVKPAEDDSGDVIVRLYESKRAGTSCTLRTSLDVAKAIECDMLENPLSDLPCEGQEIPLTFGAFKVKTIRLQLGGQSSRG